jgi:glycerol-3-phosphate acyltransferase PlsX
MRLGVDLMGSEQSPESILEVLFHIARENPEVILVAFATPEARRHSQGVSFPKNIQFEEVENFIEMDEAPLASIRRKKNASMNVGLRFLKEAKIDGFISMGNTGALMASSIIQLGQLPNVDRPGLMVHMPNDKEGVVVLDVGANLNPQPKHLLAYGLMGVSFRQEMHQLKKPRVGLLNIGTEQQKGTQGLKESFQLFEETFKDQFVGNVEGKAVFSGDVDVLVTDGFTGNVFLKTCEGITSFLTDYLSDKLPGGIQGALGPVVKHLYQRFNYSQHPGALLCGVNGIVVKCHGYSNQQALKTGIRGAIDLIQKDILSKMRSSLVNGPA